MSVKMFVCICAIFASPVICVGLFIESYVELIKAACNFYNANMKALEQGQQKWHSERCKKVTVERFLEEMFICIYAISVFPVVSIDLFVKPQSVSRQNTMFIIEAWKQLNRISNKNQKLHSKRCKKEWSKELGMEMFICIYAIFRTSCCVYWFIYRAAIRSIQGRTQRS